MLSLLCVIAWAPAASRADTFDDALAAYRAGDYPKAAKLWKTLADQGDATAMFNLGVAYASGQGVSRDQDKAVAYYRKAAEKGYAPAQFNLGAAYQNGQGVSKDLTEAAKWWRKAAVHGFLQAQYNLGTLYFYGQGVPKNLDEAAKWFRMAAAQGDQSAAAVLKAMGREEQAPPAAKPNSPKVEPTHKAAAKTAVAAAHNGVRLAAWLRGRDPRHYTIQLFANWTALSIHKFVQDHKIAAHSAVFETRFDGKPWYCLTYGEYPSFSAASTALRDLPASLKVMGPWVRSFSDVQQAIAKGEIGAKPGPGVAAVENVPMASNGPAKQTAATPGTGASGTKHAAPAPKPEKKTTEQPSKTVHTPPARPAGTAGTVPRPAASTSKAAAPHEGAAEGKPRQPATTPSQPAAVSGNEGASRSEAWLMVRPPGHYTIQMFADVSRASVLELARANRLGADTAIFESLHEGRPWYSLVYGDFASLEAAKAAKRNVPATVRKWSPWIRTFRSVQVAIRERRQAEKGNHHNNAKPVPTHPSPPAKPAASATPPVPRVARVPAGAARMLEEGQGAFNGGHYREALRLWRPLAEAGVAAAQYNLGFLYESGWGVPRDYREAAKWYELAADQGNAKAEFNLGLMRIDGSGVTKNIPIGLALVEQSAAKGHTKAQEFLADAYREGRYGLPQDEAKAKAWAAKAAVVH